MIIEGWPKDPTHFHVPAFPKPAIRGSKFKLVAGVTPLITRLAYSPTPRITPWRWCMQLKMGGNGTMRVWGGLMINLNKYQLLRNYPFSGPIRLRILLAFLFLKHQRMVPRAC